MKRLVAVSAFVSPQSYEDIFGQIILHILQYFQCPLSKLRLWGGGVCAYCIQTMQTNDRYIILVASR